MSAPPPSYRPTPLERSYASHLLQTHFATPFSPAQFVSEDDAETIRVPGRNAVPFLTTSGVERSLLRLVWSISDPDSVGTLLRRSQFYVMLRLVAMAQAHFLPPLNDVGMSDTDKMTTLRETLDRNAHLVVALPTFDADKDCPSVAYLMGTYPPPANVGASPAMDFSSANMADMWQNQQQPTLGSATGGLSVMDAFGSMGEAEDRPLPSLALPSPVVEEEDVASSSPVIEESGDGQFDSEGDDDFGNFDSVPVPEPSMDDLGAAPGNDDFGDIDSNASQPTTVLEVTAPAGYDHDDFGDFGSNTSAPVMVESEFGDFGGAPAPALPVESAAGGEDAMANTNIVPEEAEDDFGGFASISNDQQNQIMEYATTLAAGASNNDMMDEVKTESSADDDAVAAEGEEGGDDSFGAFGDFEAPPANMSDTSAVDEDQVTSNIGDGGTGFGTMAALPPLGNTADKTLSISDAFDSLVPEQPQLQDDIDDPGAHVEANDDTDGFGDFEGDTANQESEEDGSFGNFGSSGQLSADADIHLENGHSPEESVGFGSFGSSGQGPADTAMTASNVNYDGGITSYVQQSSAEASTNTAGHHLSVFDAMVDVQDAPLPPLGAFSASIVNDNNDDAAVEDDDFGDFAAGPEAGDAGDTNMLEEVNDNFGDFDGTSDANTVSEEDAAIVVDREAEGSDVIRDSFGDFAGTADINNAGLEEEPAMVVDEEDNHFGDSAGKNENEANNFDGDAFGGFEEVPIGESNTRGASQEVAVSGTGFGDFGDNSGQQSSADDAADGENDDVKAGTLDKLSVFDALAEVQDAPLPSLASFGSGNNLVADEEKTERVEVAEEEDDFGGFEAGPPGEDEAEAADNELCPEEEEAGNDCGDDPILVASEGAESEMPEQNADAEPSNLDSIGFGTTSEPAAAVGGDENKLSSALFDVFGDVQDAPLPSLGAFSSAGNLPAMESNDNMEVNEEVPAPDNNDDDFGDFEGTIEKEVGDMVANETPQNGEAGLGVTNILDLYSNSSMNSAPFGTLAPESSSPEMATTANLKTEDKVDDGEGLDDFGGFEAPGEPTAADETDVVGNANIDGTMNPTQENVASDNDGFGDFGGFEAPAELPSAAETDVDTTDNVGKSNALDAVAENKDLVGGFGENQDDAADLPTADQATNDDDLLFGDFNATPEGSGANSGENLFDAFSEIPPPPLGHFPAEEQDGGNGNDNAFGGFSTQVQEVQRNNDDDNFGQFEAFPADVATNDYDVQDNSDSGLQKNEDGDDNFQGFEAFPAAATEDVIQDNHHGDESFGDFEAFPATESTTEEVQKDDVEDDNFGQFDAPAAVQSDAEDANFGQFEAFPAAVSSDGDMTKKDDDKTEDLFEATTQKQREEEDMAFGDFGEGHEGEEFGPCPEESAEPEKHISPMINEGVENDDKDESFGQFEAFPATSKAVQNIDDEGVNFGQFDAHTNADIINRAAPTDGDEFGTFEEPSSIQNKDEVGAAAGDDNDDDVVPENNDFGGDDDFGDFGDFEESSSNGNIEAVATDGDAGAVSESNNKLDDDFGDADGFGDFSSFEEAATPAAASHQHDEEKSPDKTSIKKGDLEETLRTKLGNDFVKLPSNWKNVIFSAVEADLQRGNKIVDYVSNKVSSKDKAFIVKSRKLRDHISGLAEFVRVIRSIAASIGELLGVDKNVDVHESTLSQYYNNAIIADAIVIEYLWSEISSKAVALGIFSTAPQLESVVEIRSAPLTTDKDEFCQLTLRPLKKGASCTQSHVVWNGKKYMACAANFCANRVPEHAI